MKPRNAALMRAAVMTGAGALVETARRGIKRAISRRRRERTLSKSKAVLKKAGIAAAIAGAAFGTIAAVRAARYR